MQHPLHWRDAAILKSEALTDAWEVSKVWAGRAAEWILFLCMIANIIQILPGVQIAAWLTNTVLGVQAVTLDIAGFGLATMAQQALRSGETEAARKAKQTAYWLIGLMMVTVISVSIGNLWPVAKTYTDVADKILILVRVATTVWYGHVLHDLRQHTRPVVPVPVLEEQLQEVQQQLTEVKHQQERHQATVRTALMGIGEQLAQLPAPEPVNYAALAEQIVPLFPAPAVPDFAPLVEQITAIAEQVKQRASEQKADKIVTPEQTDSDAEVTLEQPESEPAADIESDARIVKLVNRKAPPAPPRGEGLKRAQRIIKRQPDITPTELAKRANISRSYASQLLAERGA